METKNPLMVIAKTIKGYPVDFMIDNQFGTIGPPTKKSWKER